MEMQDGGGGNGHVRFLMQAMDSSAGEHRRGRAKLRVAELDTNLGGAQSWIENRADIADLSSQQLRRVGIQGERLGFLCPGAPLGRSFSYTSQRIQTEDKSEIVKGFVDERP